jgi:hypothetical protein
MISQTVATLMTAVMEELEIVSSGGSITTNEQASFVDRLQRFIDSAGVQKPLLFGERIDPLTFTTNKQSYTIGIDPTASNTADFNVPWPTKIERANVLISSTVRRPIRILNPKQWAAIRYQNVTGPPQALYFDRRFGSQGGALSGFGTMYFYMIPDQAYSWELYSWDQLLQVASTTTLLNYPSGYAEFWLYGMCIRAASMFGTTPTDLHIQLFKDAREGIATENTPSPLLVASDVSMIGDGGEFYNWLTGETEAGDDY